MSRLRNLRIENKLINFSLMRKMALILLLNISYYL